MSIGAPRTYSLTEMFCLLCAGRVGRVFPFPGDTEFKVTCFNDLDILPDGRLVVSEASTRYPLHDYLNDFVEGRPTGR